MRATHRFSLVQALSVTAILAILGALLIPIHEAGESAQVRLVVRRDQHDAPNTPIYVAIVKQPDLARVRHLDWSGLAWWSLDDLQGTWMQTLSYRRAISTKSESLKLHGRRYEPIPVVVLIAYPQPDGTAHLSRVSLLKQPDQLVIDLIAPLLPPHDAEFVPRNPVERTALSSTL